MKARTRAREAAFQILFRYDQSAPEGGDLEADLMRHFAHFEVPENVREFTRDLVTQSVTHRKDIDALIEKYSKQWKISRMSAVDRSLLRLGIAEILTHPEIELPVTLDEIVELAKQFGSEDSSRFVNGILDPVGRELRPTEARQSS